VFLPFLVTAACGPGLSAAPADEPGVGAGTGPTDAAVVAAEPTALDRAREAYAARDWDTASAAAQEFLAALPPDHAAADAARLVAARVAILDARWDEARGLLDAVTGTDAKFVPGYRNLIELLAADAAGTLAASPEDERRSAAERLSNLALLPDDPALTAPRLALQLRLDSALGLREALVRHAAELLPLADPPAARRWTGEAEAILGDPSALTDAEVESLFGVVSPDSPLWPSVARRRVEVALAAGDLATATSVLDGVEARHGGAEWVEALRARIAGVANVDPGRIGVLLPISGASAAIGARVLAAMELALAPYGDRFVLEVRDTGGDEATTRAAVQALAGESRAIAVLGPMEARVATAAVAEATTAGIPILSLNVQRDVASAADCRFRDFPTFAAEVEVLVEYAWSHARGHRFAVLRAEGRYGELLDGLVADAVERRGGELVAIPPYATDRTEFIDLAEQVRREQPDAILFADAAARVALVAPALAYEDLWPQAAPHDPASPAPGGPRREALYLLPSAAVDAAALGEARRYVEGAVAALGFVPAARPEERTAFETAFAGSYPSGATQLDALAYDAARIVASLVDAGATNRPALCRALDAVETADTAAPFTGFGPDGEARRPVRLVVVRDGKPVPLEP